MFDFVRSPKFPYFLVFLTGVVLRGIPELLVSWYPVGYETIAYYAPTIVIFSKRSLIDVFVDAFRASPLVDVHRPLLDPFRAGPFFYVLMWLASVVSGAHIYLILKVVGPLLYGFLALSFLVFSKHGLNLNMKMAFVATLILVFQPVALRESWDRFRTVLGLVFLLATLTALKSKSRFKWPVVASLAVLTALSREYVALVLFVAVLGFAFLERKDGTVSFFALAPALSVFAVMVYPTRLSWNYVAEVASPFSSGTYLFLLQDVFSIFAVCYLPLLLFVVKGFRRDKLLDPMLGLLLLGSFSVILSPWFAVPGYQRWLILLVFPFSIYAVRGFERFRLFDKGSFRKLVAILLVFLAIGVGYSSGSFSYVVLPSSWVPTNLVQSSIAWNQVDDAKDVLRWLDENAKANSSVLVEERFYGWTLIYLKRANIDVRVIPYAASSSPMPSLEMALHEGFSRIYWIWFTGQSVSGFQMVYSQDAVSVFQYLQA